MTIIRKYLKKQGAARDYSMAFKADVSVVKDSDYQDRILRAKRKAGGAGRRSW